MTQLSNSFLLPHFIKMPDKKTIKIPRYGNKVLYVGRLSGEKGVEYLIQSLSQILNKYPETVLYIVGRGKLNCELRRMTRYLQIKGNVTFLGYKNSDQLDMIYRSVDLLVLPSICSESFGLVLLEAMSYRLPVITTNIGAQSELIKNGFNGYLVPIRNPMALANMISEILRDEDLRDRMGQNGEIFAKEFNETIYFEALKQIYAFSARARARF